MRITIEQARSLDAIAKYRTFSRAAEDLGKGHSAVVYSLKTLEDDLDLQLLDRSEYRTKLTPVGERVLVQCQKILNQEKELEKLCSELQTGWEAYLQIVVDGIVQLEPIMKSLASLQRQEIPTTIKLYSAFLNGVEEEFTQKNADIMISVLPPERIALTGLELPTIKSCLVVSSFHPLAQKIDAWATEDLHKHTLLTIKGSDRRLNLSTGELESSFHVNDFATKKMAIINEIGYGWLPEYMIEKELEDGVLTLLNTESIQNTHIYRPHLYHFGEEHLGQAAQRLIALIKG